MDRAELITIKRPAFEVVQNVDVYFNLHHRVWSCRDRRTGRVIAHADVIVAPHGGRFVVQEGGRQRVLREERKNVHAFVRLDYADACNGTRTRDEWLALGERDMANQAVSYNPYRAGHFFHCQTGAPVSEAACVVMVATAEKAPRCWAIEGRAP